MSRRLRLTLLGTGSSGGVPRVGGDWGACDPNEPRNRRQRCSALVEVFPESPAKGNRPTRVLIDTSPDLREQLLKHNVDALDAVIFSHDHADQTHGIDDIRPLAYKMRRQIPAYLDTETRETLEPKFHYIFWGQGGYPPILGLQPVILPGEPFIVDGPGGSVEFLPLRQQHGAIVSLGFRIGDLAYCNDINAFPDSSIAALKGVDTFIVDALRYAPHASHAHLEQSLEWSRIIGARRCILTNLHVDMDYQTLRDELPEDVEPAYDGMAVDLSYPDA